MAGVLLPTPVAAQQWPGTADDPVTEAPIRLGVVSLKPRLGIRNVGIDTNVLNTPEEDKDFTATVATGGDLYMRTGRGLLSVTGGLEFVHFNKFASERSVNGNARAQYEFRFNRLRPYASIAALNTRERPGYEIDARARHYETDIHGGVDLRTGSKGVFRLDGRHLRYSFAGDAVFAGRPLNQELNRTLVAADLAWRQRLTVLTTWVTRVSRESERFQFEDFRNSNSTRISTGFELSRFALIWGTAFVGYRNLAPASGGTLPKFSGATADIDVSYTAPSQTRLSVAVDRDLHYSYERATPYYVQTGWTASVTQRIIGRWDAQLTGGRDRLSYQAIQPGNERTDLLDRYGGGIGHALNQDIRISLDIIRYHRSSVLPLNRYSATRAGISVTYGY